MEGITIDQFRTLVKAMKSVYSQPTFIADEDAFKTWYFMLCDIPYQPLQNGIQMHMQSQKFPPTIAELRVAASQFIMKDEVFTDLEAWAIVRTAICRSSYYWKEEFDKLPVVIRKAVGRAENLKEWAVMEIETVESVIQSQFLRSFRNVREQEEKMQNLSPVIRDRIEQHSRNDRKEIENEYHNSTRQIEEGLGQSEE